MARDNHDLFEYDVALSFATEDKATAEELINLFTAKNIEVLRDEYTGDASWGKDVIDHFVNLYSRKARYCVVLLSRHYPLKKWTDEERQSAQERAFRDSNEYIIPIRLDETDLPGVSDATNYRDLNQSSPEGIVSFLEQKLSESKSQSGPPPESHDLRSGNVPPAHPEADAE